MWKIFFFTFLLEVNMHLHFQSITTYTWLSEGQSPVLTAVCGIFAIGFMGWRKCTQYFHCYFQTCRPFSFQILYCTILSQYHISPSPPFFCSVPVNFLYWSRWEYLLLALLPLLLCCMLVLPATAFSCSPSSDTSNILSDRNQW